MGKVILIVEDEKMIRQALHDKLNREGFEVQTAKNGADAIDMVTQSPPDLILLDIVMPKMDGMQAMRILKEDPKTAHIPIIFLTNLSDVDNIEEASERGIYEYLVKADWTLEDVCKKINDKLGIA